jgi:DNA-binding CsgD family transcriptional regulator
LSWILRLDSVGLGLPGEEVRDALDTLSELALVRPAAGDAGRLRAEGHTDEAIAKRLGVSHRTARRIASELMERLDARSRFEAGVRALQQGWLPPRP